MSVTVTEIFDGTFVDIDNTNGSAARCFLVQGVAAGAPNDMQQAAFIACGLPYNAPHPTIGGLYVKGFRAVPVGDQTGPTCSRTDFRVLVKYQNNDFTPALGAVKVEIFGSEGTEIMNRWPAGTRLQGQAIYIAYFAGSGSPLTPISAQVDPAGVDFNPTTNGGVYYDTVELPIESQNTILRFTRRETGSPLLKSRQFRRTVNATAWQGFPPLSVKCRSIDASNVIGVGNVIAANLYDVTYVFEHNASGQNPYNLGPWARVELYREPHTGKPPPGINILDGSYNGYTVVLPYAPQDFNALSLPTV